MENEKEPIGSASVRPGLVTGSLVAAMLTASLISVFYLAWKAAGLPFVPFDVFDWMTRILPGQVIAVDVSGDKLVNCGSIIASILAAPRANNTVVAVSYRLDKRWTPASFAAARTFAEIPIPPVITTARTLASIASS